MTHLERGFGLLLLMATLCIGAFALDRDRSIGQFYYTFWSEKDGAPSEITALAQTRDGYLWIGSSRGLFRFDGVRFEEYQPQPGVELPSHSIFSLMATPDGGLWIAFEPNGLGFYKDGSLTVFTRRDEVPESPAHCFARDNDGGIWAGTETGLEFRQGNRWIPVGHEWNFTPETIRYLLVDREGTLWVATIHRVVYLKRGARKFELGGPVGTGVTTLAQAPDGQVWLADDGSFEVRPVPTAGRDSTSLGPRIAADGLHDLLFDKDGALWITRMDSGIVRIRDPGKLGRRRYGIQDRELDSFAAKDGFPAGFADKIFEDREGNIWVGCSNGVIRFRHNQVVPVRLPQRYERLTLMPGKDDELWVGTTSDKPLLKIRGETIAAGKGGDTVSSVLRDANGDLWWGSRAGVWRQRESDITFFPLSKDATPDWMWDLMPTADNRGLWVKLGDIGLVRFNQGAWDLHDWPQGVPKVGGTFKYGPSASFRDASGRFWLGYTSGQIYAVEDGHATEYSQRDGLDLGRIKVIRGQADHIWAGGELGVEFFSKGRFWKVQAADGKPFGAVSGIVQTPDAGLWLNEMSGIVQIPQDEIRQVLAQPGHSVSCRRFDYLDGLPGSPQMSFTNSTAARTADGRLWFATDNGLARIDPARIVGNPLPPPVTILFIGDENGHKALFGPVSFAAGTHTIEIDYAGLSLSLPERVRFRCKLEGVDKEWQDVGTRRQAFYSNLGHGSYRFRVIACNNDGVWNESGASIDFSIAPAYYQTTWFAVLCAAVLAGLLWAFYRLRLHQIRQHFRAGFEERVDERMRIARDLHDTLLQSFQGLTLHFQRARNLLPGRTSEAIRTLDAALDEAEQALVEGRDAIHDLRTPITARKALEDEIRALGEELVAKDSDAKEPPEFRIVVEGSTHALRTDLRTEIFRIVREALRNAFSHSHGRLVETEMAYTASLFRLRIRDDGKGIDANERLQAERSGHWGLRGMRERAGQIGGELQVWSEPGAGTEIELRIPAAIAYEKAASQNGMWLFWKRGRNR